MAVGPNTKIADVVVPEIFTPYVQLYTEEKSRLVQSGAFTVEPELNTFLDGGGLTVTMPRWKDLDNDPENISTDDEADVFKRPGFNDTRTDSVPYKIGTVAEIAVRLSRNNSWASADLTAALAGADPMNAIAARVGDYRVRRLQTAFISVMAGVFANNATATDAYHTQNDMTHDISGTVYTPGVTDFSAEAVLDTMLTMGDSMDKLTMVMMHSVVYNRAQKNNLIDFIPDARGEVNIPTFLGRTVIVDDGLPASGGVYQTWMFGPGAIGFGQGSPKVATEVDRKPEAGNGGGQEILYNRWEWIIHPRGFAYIGAPANGGPSNAGTTNNLANAGSWRRVWPERKMVAIARLITREA